MDARAHESIAVATFADMPDAFKRSPLGLAMGRPQPEEWQLYTVMPDRIDGDNIMEGYFHSHKFEFDDTTLTPAMITIEKTGEQRPLYANGSAHPVILS